MKGEIYMAETELQKIEKEMQKLRERKKEILDEVRAKKDSEKKVRKEEVEKAYKNFIDLLEKYENDYEDGYKVTLSGNFSC